MDKAVEIEIESQVGGYLRWISARMGRLPLDDVRQEAWRIALKAAARWRPEADGSEGYFFTAIKREMARTIWRWDHAVFSYGASRGKTDGPKCVPLTDGLRGSTAPHAEATIDAGRALDLLDDQRPVVRYVVAAMLERENAHGAKAEVARELGLKIRQVTEAVSEWERARRLATLRRPVQSRRMEATTCEAR